jgi:hypothetical protein
MANLCSAYATVPAGGCNSNFTNQSSAAGATQKTGDPSLDKLHAALADGSGIDGTGGKKTKTPKQSANPFTALHQLTDPRVANQRQTTMRNATGSGTGVSQRFGPQSAQDQALDYLLGNDR